jgi:hypothetical protein
MYRVDGKTITLPYRLPHPQFASWEIDHNRFEVKQILGKGVHMLRAFVWVVLTWFWLRPCLCSNSLLCSVWCSLTLVSVRFTPIRLQFSRRFVLASSLVPLCVRVWISCIIACACSLVQAFCTRLSAFSVCPLVMDLIFASWNGFSRPRLCRCSLNTLD